MKLTLLLIPLILLSSCTIDWNDEKDAKIGYYEKLLNECLKLDSSKKGGCIASVKWMQKNSFKEAINNTCSEGTRVSMNKTLGSKKWCEPDYYQQLQLKYPGKQNEIDYMRTHGYKEITNEGCAVGYKSYGMKVSNPIIMCVPYLEGGYIPSIIKDFGSGFTLSQTDEETTLSYSGKVIKIWSHTPPEKVPFIWDEACTLVWKGFEKLSPENQSIGKQGVWDALTEKEKKDCIKENLQNSILINPSTGSIFTIRKTAYETYTEWEYDSTNGKFTEKTPNNRE